jgi:hypothetical protein
MTTDQYGISRDGRPDLRWLGNWLSVAVTRYTQGPTYALKTYVLFGLGFTNGALAAYPRYMRSPLALPIECCICRLVFVRRGREDTYVRKAIHHCLYTDLKHLGKTSESVFIAEIKMPMFKFSEYKCRGH